MELRPATRRSDRNTTQRVDSESDETDSSDEIVFICLPDRENLAQGEIKINEISHLQRAARRTETNEKTAVRHANTKQCKTRTEVTVDNASVGSADIEARRTKISRAMREARRLETPEQTAARRAKANEGQRKRRELYRAAMEKAKREFSFSKETKTVSASRLCNSEADVTWSNKQEMKRLTKLRELREARNLQTPEQAAARRAKAAEIQRKRRERLREARKTETPEETAARLAKEAELAKRITPEQAAARRAKRAVYERKRRQRKALKEGKRIKSEKQHVATETPKQLAARRKRATELQRNNRAERKPVTSTLIAARLVKKRTETPEEAAVRRAKAAAYERQRRQRKALKRSQERAKETEREKLRRKLRAETETPEQAATRRKKAADSQRMRRDLLRDEMPERIAALRAKATAYERQRRQRKACQERSNAAERERIRRANETPDQTVIRRAKTAAAQRKKREELKAAGETPEQTSARHAKEDERRKRKEMRLTIGESNPLNSTKSAEDDLYRLERLRLLREARKRETPVEAAARRAKANECQKRRREQIRAMREAETPEQTAARIARETELREAETPQQAAARRTRRSEYRKERKQDHAAAETPEAAIPRREKAAARERKRRLDNAFTYANAIERKRQKRKLLKETETPEQAAERRAKAAANQRKRREQKRAAREPHAPTFKWLHDNVTAAEKERRRRAARAETETPEQAADRRAKAAAREKQRRQRKAFACLQDSALLAKCKIERMERIKEARKKETPEQAAARREKAALSVRRRREKMRATRKQCNESQLSDSNVRKGMPRTRFQKATAENTSSQRNYTDEELHSSSTRSAIERPEGSSSIISIETSITITEFKEDPWLCFDNSDLSIISENLFNEKEVFESFADVSKDLVVKSSENNYHTGSDDQMAIATNLTWFSKLLDANKRRDEHTVYCEYIAERLRKCNRSITEIEVAKNIIEGIMFNLSTGAYRSLSSAFPNEVEQKGEAPTIRPPIIEPVVQAIILKEEVQL